ncbi:MAG: YqaJ viral recombinase family protein, partial [Planctomycetota bacterium]
MGAPKLDFSRIGGSDTGAILGISPFVGDTPVSVWARIVAHRGMPGVQVPEDKDSDPIYWGNKLEPIVIEEIAERLNVDVNPKPAPILHGDFGFDLRANPDGVVVGRKGELVEAKTTNAFSDKVWREGVPRYYTSQADFYMAAFDANVCHVGCLVGGQRFRLHRVERNRKREDFLMGKLVEFWRYVENGEPPPMVSTDDVDILYPDGSDELVAYADSDILEDLE